VITPDLISSIGNLRLSWWNSVLGRGSTASRIANAVALAALIGYAVFFSIAGAHAGDAHAYWAADIAHPYTTAVNQTDAYLYSPAFLIAIAPLKVLPWEAFWVVWTALNLGVLAWLVGPVLAVLVLLPGPYSPVWVNLWYGNIIILMAAALLLVFRKPGAWSFLLLTKITPGVGLIWFVARREWRYLRDAALFTAGVIAISLVIGPALWIDWMHELERSAALPAVFIALPPLWMRLTAALMIAGIGGFYGARWTVILAAVLAQPVFWFTGFTMFITWLGLVHHRRWLNASASRPRAEQ
jgi:hypothetical protein